MIQLPGPLIRADWLRERVENVYVADVRWYLDGRSGRTAYEGGHIPNAVWVDLDRDLAGPTSPGSGRHPLPDPEDFAAALGRLGIAWDRPVVAYDDAAGSIAARMWWMLRTIGQPAAVLDGGIGTWPGPLETTAARPVVVDRPARPWPAAAIASTADVNRLRRQPDAVVLDARSPARYQGVEEPVDARPGHVPGAVNHPWTDNVGPDGRLLAPGLLRDRLAAAGAGPDRQVITSCGSGVTACHNLLAMEVAGLPAGLLYPGSWSAWAAQPGLPAATGPDPG
jgi:thiosulfate/3-mercaptopyruvate sulfurtransferase